MAELLSVTRLFADGYHNAFTDLMFWKGHCYLSFRTAQSHTMPPMGDVVVYRSADLANWSLCARFDTGGDDRDPKLIDAGDRLAVVFGTWFPRWGDGSRTVPSAGDCSYAGLAHGPEGEVLMSYYSQHEHLPLPAARPPMFFWRGLPFDCSLKTPRCVTAPANDGCWSFLWRLCCGREIGD